jgi:hypothetical protein
MQIAQVSVFRLTMPSNSHKGNGLVLKHSTTIQHPRAEIIPSGPSNAGPRHRPPRLGLGIYAWYLSAGLTDQEIAGRVAYEKGSAQLDWARIYFLTYFNIRSVNSPY